MKKRGRPRTRSENINLPPGMFKSRGRYYKSVRGRWYGLGADEALAIVRAAEFKEPLRMTSEHVEDHLVSYVWVRARNNAIARKLEFTLTREDVAQLAKDAHYRCAVTRVYFSLDRSGTKNRQRPFAPSLDRINSELGYSLSNCRVVCIAANLAMNSWGEAVLHRMLDGRRLIGRS